jgi:uncharacterized membrane protein YvbJ
MFCPNCAAQNEAAQHYCRMCGLKLDAVAAELALQKPSVETAELLKRQKLMQRIGRFSLSTAGVIGLALLLAQVIYYKLMIFGPELLFGGAIGAVVLSCSPLHSFLSIPSSL